MVNVLKRPAVLGAAGLVVASAWALFTNLDTVLNSHPSYLILYVGSLVIGAAVIGVGIGRRDRRRRLWLSIPSAVLLLALAGADLWLAPFGATQVALDAMGDSDAVIVTSTMTEITFEPRDTSPEVGVVFYPGARVDTRAYAHLLRPLAEAGHMVVIVKEPLGIAFLSTGFAGSWIEDHPEVTTWIVAGHSLGGVVASMNAGSSTTGVDGLLLWASYPSSDISGSAVDALSVFGTNDGLTTPDRIAESVPDLPPSAEFVPIEGGIHSFFGNYGLQPGDGEPGVPREVAQAEIVEATLAFALSMASR
jgi:hypothetical protein